MNYYIWIRSSKGRSEQFWTGTTWTTIFQFARVYSFNEAIAIIEKRFHSKLPKPLIQRESYFAERERAKRAKYKKKDKKEDDEN